MWTGYNHEHVDSNQNMVRFLIATTFSVLFSRMKENHKFVHLVTRKPFGFLWPIIAKDDLGVLSSRLQHSVSQMRHLLHIFHPSAVPPLVQDVVQDDLSTITDNDHFPLVSFFAPAFRQHGLNHPWSTRYTQLSLLYHALMSLFYPFQVSSHDLLHHSLFRPWHSLTQSIPKIFGFQCLHLGCWNESIAVSDQRRISSETRFVSIYGDTFWRMDSLRLNVMSTCIQRSLAKWKEGRCHNNKLLWLIYTDDVCLQRLRWMRMSWKASLSFKPLVHI